MEEGTKAKKTVFVGGIGDDTDEAVLYESFSTFGAFNAKRETPSALTKIFLLIFFLAALMCQSK